MIREVRVGSVVQIHRGAAAVTGDDLCNPGLLEATTALLWEGAE